MVLDVVEAAQAGPPVRDAHLAAGVVPRRHGGVHLVGELTAGFKLSPESQSGRLFSVHKV